MTGRLGKIENIINGTISSYAHTKLMPRGLPQYADPLLRGEVRFAKRAGSNLSILLPDNYYMLAADVYPEDTSIALTQIPSWAELGSLMSMGPYRELLPVNDIIGTKLHTRAISGAYAAGTKILLYASPAFVSVNALVGSIEVVIKTARKLFNGDIFCYAQSALLESITEIRIAEALSIGTTTDPTFPMLYRITLSEPLQTSLISDTAVYYRSLPAYASQSIRVPRVSFTAEPMGPFLVDNLSGPLTEGPEIGETLSIKAFNKAGRQVYGPSGGYLQIPKNFGIYERPFSSEYPLFWELGDGEMRMFSGRLLCKVDTKLHFSVAYQCVPKIRVNNSRSWRLSVISNETATLVVHFKPTDPHVFNLSPGPASALIIDIPAGVDVTDIELVVIGSSTGTEVTIGDWTPVSDTIETLEYSIVSDATGYASWASTGLIIKPYFYGMELLSAQYDNSHNYDSGRVYS